LGGQSLGSNIIEALGVAATEQAGGIPGVPTFAEQGVKDQEADTLTGIVAPAGTPKDIVDLLSREIATSVAPPDVNERLAVLGFKAVGNTHEEFGARIKLEIEKWGKVVRDANLRIERPAGSNACCDRFRNIFQLVEASVTRL
jgi:tripartite-type tricarboxylate transporter receptor subunit TctC